MPELTIIPINEAITLANCPGLTADLICHLAKRYKLLSWGEIPGQGAAVEKHGLLELSTTLRAARNAGAGQFITGAEAEVRYGIHRSTWGRWRDRGIIRNEKDLLYLEDVAFVAKLAELTGYTRGRPLFPTPYKPYDSVAQHLDSATDHDQY